jgi:pimeloyl-ACP methyl ester carboxylesterase
MTPARSAASLLFAPVLLAVALLAAGCGWVEERGERREAAAERAFPPEGQFVEVSGGRRVHAVVRGHGPDLVLLHGASGNTRDFTFSFVDRVSDRYRVIVFDRPGHGYTDRADPASYADSPAAQAAMLHEAAMALGAPRPIVLGHSYGGAVAMAWGLDHGPAVRAGLPSPRDGPGGPRSGTAPPAPAGTGGSAPTPREPGSPNATRAGTPPARRPARAGRRRARRGGTSARPGPPPAGRSV